MTKPSKPTPDFPLFPHANRQWAKKIKGKFHYFGPWDDPQAALERFQGTAPNAPESSNVFQRIRVVKAPKPIKPHKDFPLYPHASGRWAKKVNGILRYFGPWEDPQAALEKWLAEKDDLLAGREPQIAEEGLTIKALVNQFLATKESKADAGELTRRSFDDYDATCGKIVKVFGRYRLVANLAPNDFKHLRTELAKGHGPNTLSNDIGRARVVFNWAYKQNLIERPIVYGDGFKKPSRTVLRRERQKKGARLFTPQQIYAVLGKAHVQLKAMIYLGINCGLGNNDCALLPLSAIDLENGWLTYPRPKTAVDRRAKLWPETVEALKAVLTKRKPPKERGHADKVFVTKYGSPWNSKGKTERDNPISKEFAKLLKDLDIHRPGLGFYALRHTFETIGGESLDQAAVDYVMGHAPHANDMSAVYRERMTDQRLFRVAKYVRKWLNSTSSRRKKIAASV